MKLEQQFSCIGLTDAMLKEAVMRLYGLIAAPKSYFDQLKPKDIKRFLSKIDKGPDGKGHGEKGCWLWTGTKTNTGYGIFKLWVVLESGEKRRLSFQASHVSLHHYTNANIAGYQVLHACDNPSCVRSDHLNLGTARDNAWDCSKKRRSAGFRRRGTGNPNAKYSEEQIACVRRCLDAGISRYKAAKQCKVPASLVYRLKYQAAWSGFGETAA